MRTRDSYPDSLAPPDLVIERAPGGAGFLVAPCHRRATDWLQARADQQTRWLAGALVLADGELDGLVVGALRAGLEIGLAFQARLIRGVADAAHAD